VVEVIDRGHYECEITYSHSGETYTAQAETDILVNITGELTH